MVAVQQRPDEEQRVAGSGVPAEHHHRVRAAGDAVVQRRPAELVGDQAQPEQQPGEAHALVEQRVQDLVVEALVAGPAADPQQQGGQRPEQLDRDQDDGVRQHPQRPAAHRRQDGGERGERHGDGQRADDQRGHEQEQHDLQRPPHEQGRQPHAGRAAR